VSIELGLAHCQEFVAIIGFSMVQFANSRCASGRAMRMCWIAIVLSIVALTANVATRTSVLRLQHNVSIDSQASSSSRQHLDGDAMEWTPPVATHVVAEAFSFYPLISPAGPPVAGVLFEDALYNRPPPSC